jgi:uncharacterized protein involved in exopolysaccharide biosynthesis/beta-lactamase regulating signal transducer with metallopeptidase domain
MSLTPLLNHLWLHRVGWALIHSLWQGAFIGVAYGLLTIALRRQSAQARYLAGCLALALLAASPVITFLMSSEEAGTHVATSAGGNAVFHSGSVTVPSSTPAPPASGAVPDWIVALAEQLSELTPWLALTWAAGVLVFAARLGRALWWLRTLQTADNEPLHGEWIGTLNRLRARFGISRPVQLFKSALVEVPTVLGWMRPVILLPASSILGLTSGQLEAVVAHELAHVRRFDYLVNAGQCLIETILFYHPVVWWISRQVREEREHCCDDLVVALCGNKLGYARALAAMEELRGHPPVLAFAANGGSLLGRIRRLLGTATQDGTSPARRAGGLALIGLGLLLIVVGILIHLGLPRYRAVSRIKLDSATSVDASTHAPYDPYFLQTEMEVIQSQPVLRKVIDDLGLTKKWSERYKQPGQFRNAESLAILRTMLSLHPIRNTSLLEIGVYSPNPEEARDIANAVARAYQDYHAEQVLRSKSDNLQALERRFAEHELKINEAQDRVDQLRANLSGLSSDPADETLRRLEAAKVDLKAQLVREETLLNRLKALNRDELAQVIPTAAPDGLLASLLEQMILATGHLRTVEKEYGPEHPEVVTARAQLDELQKKTYQREDGIMLGLTTRVTSLKESLGELSAESEGVKQAEIERSIKSRPYFKAKRDLEELERVGDSLNESYAAARTQLGLPSHSFVEIMDSAEAPNRPIFPNRPKATACIVLGLLLSVLGISIMRQPPGLSLQPVAAAA